MDRQGLLASSRCWLDSASRRATPSDATGPIDSRAICDTAPDLSAPFHSAFPSPGGTEGQGWKGQQPPLPQTAKEGWHRGEENTKRLVRCHRLMKLQTA